MTETYRIFAGVSIGDGSVVEDYCIVGAPPRGKKVGELETTIGRKAVLRSHTVIYAGNRIGDNVSIGTLSVIEHHVRIGNGVRMHSQVFVPEFTVIEDDAWLHRVL